MHEMFVTVLRLLVYMTGSCIAKDCQQVNQQAMCLAWSGRGLWETWSEMM